jgi:hypothetical protein
MKVKKVLFIFVILIMITTILGCKISTKTVQVPQKEDPANEQPINNSPVAEEKKEENRTGEYNRFDRISGFAGSVEELSMVGEIDDQLILAYTPQGVSKKALLMLVNPDTLSVEKKLELKGDFEYCDIKFAGDKLIVLLKNKIVVINTHLEQLQDVPLPKVIIEKIDRKSSYDEKGTSNIFFGGYDVSKDLTKLVYIDETGVNLVNSIDKSEILLSKTIKFKDYYFIEPKFNTQDKKVIATMVEYGCALGYTLFDIEKGTIKTIDINGAIYPNIFRYDTGMLMVNTHIYDKKNQIDEIKTLYLDFKFGELTEIKLEDTGETGDIIDDSYCFVGQNFASFITYKWDENENANNMFYINRLDLKTLIIEPQIISIKAADTRIIGVLNDGRIVFSYNFNPREKGVCVTKQAKRN